jgi:hypothetical protein
MSDYERPSGGLFLQPMSPGVRLFRTWQFQVSIAVPATIAVIFFIWISKVENLELEISSTAVQSLWSHHKLSLTCLGLIFPFTALVASHHRSIQAAEQIKQQQAQNFLTNHFAHTEEFIRVWRELGLPKQSVFGKSLRELHSEIFPYSVEGNLRISDTFRNRLETLIDECHFILDELRQEPLTGFLPNKLQRIREKLREQTGIELSALPSNSRKRPFTATSTTVIDIIKALRHTIEAASFLPPNSIRDLKDRLSILNVHREKACTEEYQREQSLDSLCSNLESLFELLGPDSPGNTSNLQKIKSLQNKLVNSGTFSREEINSTYPWGRGGQRSRYLDNEMKDWLSENDPRPGVH